MLKPVAEIRREKLAAEVEKAGGVVKFADKYGRNEDQVRQWATGKNGKKIANIGSATARRIEAMLGKPPNWLDHAGEVPQAIHSENDVTALQIALTSLVKTVTENIRAAGPDFVAHVEAQAREEHFSTRHHLLANLLDIAQPDRRKEAAASQPEQHRGSGGGTKR